MVSNAMRRSRTSSLRLVLLCLLLVLPLEPARSAVSVFGHYAGFSVTSFSGWRRSSEYVSVRDGTRLAVDVYRPTRFGSVASQRLPVLWTHARYHRARISDDGSAADAVRYRPAYQRFLKQGYVLAFVDARGTGASFGRRVDPFPPEEAADSYDITEWLAHQPWSTGRVGMFGTSYMGTNQYLAAAQAPPSLRALVPSKAMFDLYSFSYAGGVFRRDFGVKWSETVRSFDVKRPPPAVDGDTGARLRDEAVAEHARNTSALELLASAPLRNSEVNGELPFSTRSPSSGIEAINRSQVAIYHVAGWFDMWPRDALLWFRNLRVPQRIIIGPWSHVGTEGFDLSAEMMRWYDFWLKGIENGIIAEPPIHYFTIGAAPGTEWRASWTWPPSGVKPVPWYFCAGPSNSARSANDGRLCEDTLGASGRDSYQVTPATTSGKATRWTEGYGGALMAYSDMSDNDAMGLTYTSEVLTTDLELTGHPVVHLWLSHAELDADVVVYLEEVESSGKSNYGSEGALRLSHRNTAAAAWDNLGLPYHPGTDPSAAIGLQPEEVLLDLHPISRVFRAGHRIRISITGADSDNLSDDTARHRPRFDVLYGSLGQSRIDLPVMSSASSLTR